MGRPVRIVEVSPLSADVVRYELDRSLSSTGHEFFGASPDGDRPTDVAARRLFACGDVAEVHIHSNFVTVSSSRSPDDDQRARFESVLRDLYIHYVPGVVPTPIPAADPPIEATSGNETR